MSELDAIMKQPIPEIEKIAQGYKSITDTIIEHSQNQIELTCAIQDKEALVKEQIKLETIKHARYILQTCFLQATGRKAWDE